MAFIGKEPQEQYSSIAKQDITGNGGTSYTLNAAVATPEDIEVFINHVRQEPTTSYSVSDTTLTLTEALLSTDDCYVVFQGRTVGTRNPPDNSVSTQKIQDNAVTGAKIPNTGITHQHLHTDMDLTGKTVKLASIISSGGTTAATIDSAVRKKKILVVKLSVSILSEEYRLDDSEIEKLFNATRKLKKRGDTTEIKLDNKEGVIRKLEESREVKIMSEESLSEMVKKILTENSGKGYSQYPYGSSVRDDEEPAKDYMEDWKALSLNLIRDESRDTAISIAKILVKDLELFEDVLDLAGQNQSVGQEILRKLQELEEEA